jgi:hypothetical protein
MPDQGNSSDAGCQNLGNGSAETSPLGGSSTNDESLQSSSSNPVKNDEDKEEPTAGAEGDAE